jgi:N-methylhydantoinase A
LKSFRIGCDIGGTFTDVIIFDEESGEMTLIKEPTTPKNIEVGAYKGIKRAIETAKLNPKGARYVSHATTVATNAIIGQIGLELSKTGFITTKGFRDLLEIGRQIRPDPYDFFTDKPRPLVPRYLRKEVTERIGFDGRIIKKLNEDELRKVVKELKEERVSSVAVCTLFSFLNPIHEKRIREIIREEYPEVKVSLSHEVLPEFREYERASTTVINAALIEIVENYINSLKSKLKELKLACELLIMQSNGRAMSSEMVKIKPVHIVESGPAAGAIAAAYMGKLMGYENLVSFDMGGTTTKTCLIERGEPKVTTDFEVGGAIAYGRIVRGSGWPIKIPVTDLVEIGAGGGSIAWIDTGGALRVGPKSAGAEPGPACYSLGGREPTITDAYVVLGVINPNYFLGGEMKIYYELANKAIKEKVADELGMDVIEAANGIAQVANSNMARALRIVTVERGKDPRELPIMAFGGAGPMVICELIKELRFNFAIIPNAPGLFSAYGLLVTNIGHDYSLTYITQTKNANLNILNEHYRRLEKRGIEDLRKEEVSEDKIIVNRSMDLRYVGQSYELTVSVPNGFISSETINEIERRFHKVHEEKYGYCVKGEPIEIVNLRLAVIGLVPPLKIKKVSEQKEGKDVSYARKHQREVYFAKEERYVKCDIYDRYKLRVGNEIYGPAIIEQADTTTVIQPDYKAIVDEFGQLIISKA